MFEMHLISGITDGWQGREPPPAKLNVKTGTLPSLYFGIIYYSFGFSRLLFCVFRSIFRWFRFLDTRGWENMAGYERDAGSLCESGYNTRKEIKRKNGE